MRNHWCLWFHKDTNLKAIHNCLDGFRRIVEGVYGSTKILIWKQFTTKAVEWLENHNGVYGSTKILIWKQFTTENPARRQSQRCLWFHKDTNLKAIHNLPEQSVAYLSGVYGSTKILIWKQFTTLGRLSLHRVEGVYGSTKILIWKQFTTQSCPLIFKLEVFMVPQRY